MTDQRIVPLFTCYREYAGHQCERGRGHHGQHECGCGTAYTNAPVLHVPHHDLVTMTFPESSAA